jgi:hypothetical protein
MFYVCFHQDWRIHVIPHLVLRLSASLGCGSYLFNITDSCLLACAGILSFQYICSRMEACAGVNLFNIEYLLAVSFIFSTCLVLILGHSGVILV